jgi:hypothetical protein
LVRLTLAFLFHRIAFVHRKIEIRFLVVSSAFGSDNGSGLLGIRKGYRSVQAFLKKYHNGESRGVFAPCGYNNGVE